MNDRVLCVLRVTQYSSTVYIGIAIVMFCLGKYVAAHVLLSVIIL